MHALYVWAAHDAEFPSWVEFGLVGLLHLYASPPDRSESPASLREPPTSSAGANDHKLISTCQASRSRASLPALASLLLKRKLTHFRVQCASGLFFPVAGSGGQSGPTIKVFPESELIGFHSADPRCGLRLSRRSPVDKLSSLPANKTEMPCRVADLYSSDSNCSEHDNFRVNGV